MAAMPELGKKKF